ncbi:PLP-dependent aminotransferase family protein [Bacillus salitolerans]|uniref:PLP-dependent aminotransferase family protein n=1 Tax=Bacillus salitolerans TaxID=1437434 RepID=A0ABW4LQH1_9BACI
MDKEPVFQKVYEYLDNRIKRGDWKEHEKIPSVRKLGEELGVHRLTVLKAYQRLKEQHKLYVKDKSGYFVHPGASYSFSDMDDPIVTSFIYKSHLSEIHRIPVKYQFSYSLIDPNLLPNHYFSEHMKEVFDLNPKVLSTYSTIQGDNDVREALAQYFNKKYQFHLAADDLLITSGSQQAIDILSRIFIQRGDVVLMERPTYSAAIDIFRQQGAKIVTIDIHPYGYDLNQVEAFMKNYKPRIFYMNPTFHNPTGYTVPTNQRKELVDLAEKYKCFLLEDDPFNDIYFHDLPPKPLFSYDTSGYVLYIRSFSKYIAPGLRIAVLCTRPSIMKHVITVKSLTDNGTPLLNQKMFLHYFSSARLQQHIEKLRIALHIRKEIMEEELATTNWNWISPNGGLNLWIQLPDTLEMETLLATSLDHSISFVPGSICDPTKDTKSWIRLSYSYIKEQMIREGIQKLLVLSNQIENR